jgi:selenide,water dikinase
MYELLAGGVRELNAMGATLVGGHSIEGPQTTIGFSMLAEAGSAPPRVKGALQEGDVLVLTKPLGSGVLLAAHMQARCRAEWLEALVDVLVTSNRQAAAVAQEFEVRAITDITGFGLAGHLLEMLVASQAGAELELSSIPLLPGVEPLITAGIESTLAPANRQAEAAMSAAVPQQQLAQYAALFDPQTSGGLLLGVPEQQVTALLKRLADVGIERAAIIGRVIPLSGLASGTRLSVR